MPRNNIKESNAKTLTTKTGVNVPLWRRALRRTRGYFLTGLVVAMPLVITLYLANWFIDFVDNQVLPLLTRAAPSEATPLLEILLGIPGLGLFIAILSLIFLGWLAGYVFGQTLINLGERIVDKVPLVRSIYHALKQIFQTVLSDRTSNFQEVCLIEYPRKGVFALAFITTHLKGEISHKAGGGKNKIAVFLPTTPNPTSGFLLFLPRTQVTPLEMSVESGIKMVISGGLLEPQFSMPKKAKAKKAKKKKT